MEAGAGAKPCAAEDCPCGDQPQPLTAFYTYETGKYRAICKACFNARRNQKRRKKRRKKRGLGEVDGAKADPYVPWDELDRLRKVRGLTLKELAAAAGISERALGRAAERGELKMGTADRAAIALGYSLSLVYPELYE